MRHVSCVDAGTSISVWDQNKCDLKAKPNPIRLCNVHSCGGDGRKRLGYGRDNAGLFENQRVGGRNIDLNSSRKLGYFQENTQGYDIIKNVHLFQIFRGINNKSDYIKDSNFQSNLNTNSKSALRNETTNGTLIAENNAFLSNQSRDIERKVEIISSRKVNAIENEKEHVKWSYRRHPADATYRHDIGTK